MRLSSGSDRAPDGGLRVGFFDDSLKQARKIHYKFVGIAFAAITILAFGLLSLYWGSYFAQEANAYRLTVRIIDLDSQALPGGGAVLGPAVVQATMNNARAMPHYHLGWQYEGSLERFSLGNQPGAPANVSSRGIDASQYARDLVLNQDVFGVVLIHANATSAALQAFTNPSSIRYESQGAIGFYYEEARNFYSENQYVTLHTTQVLEAATTQANTEFARRQLTAAATTGSAYNFAGFCPTGVGRIPMGELTPTSEIPIAGPFYYSQYNLRPFDAFAATVATTAGAIYLLLFTFFIGNTFKIAFDPFSKKLTTGSEIMMRMLVPLIGYFWISLMYSLVSLAFLIPFDRYYTRAGFFVYWMLNWITQLGLGFILEFVLLLGGPMVTPFFLLFWIIVNVSVVFLDISDMDRIYMYGFITPVWNNVDASKSIIFGTKNHLGQNFGVEFAWAICGMVAVASFVAVSRRRPARST